MDGEITIGTRLDTDKFDRQISDLEKKMKKEEDKKIVIDAKLGSQQEELDKARQKTDALADAYQRLKEVQDRLATGQATPKEFSTFQDLQNTYGSLEKLGSEFDRALTKQNAIEQKVAQTKYRYDEINAKVSEYKQKIENVKIQKQVSDVEKLKNSFNSIGSSIQSTVKHVARLALGIFGIRSAFMFLRRASSDLASYDQQYAINLEYIRYALTQMIAPVLQWIVNLAAKLLGYINAIMQAWFGINLFSRGSAENFNKMKAGASGASKAVKEIKKQLAGFDEINMLTDQSDTGTSAGAGGVGMPSFDLSAMQGEVPEWLQWIIDHKDEILSVLAGIATALTLIHFGVKPLTALGIGAMVTGLLITIKSLKKYLEAPTWENFGKIIQGIGIFLTGLLGIILGFPGVVAGVVVFITGLIIQHWNEIKSFLQGGIDWLKGKSDWVHEMVGDTIGSIYDYFIARFQAILNFANGWVTSFKQVFDGIITFFKGVFTGNWEMVFEGLKKIVSGFVNNIINIFNYVLSFLKDRVSFWGSVVGNAFGGAFKAVVNAVLRTIEAVLNTPIKAINKLISTVNSIPGINLGYLNTFNLPRLKTGAIVNMPNKGTLVAGGRAIAGEAGHEGIIPLDDNQAMAQLGAEIGRNVVVNLTNITKVGNRQIAREIKQINAEQEFAYNM